MQSAKTLKQIYWQLDQPEAEDEFEFEHVN